MTLSTQLTRGALALPMLLLFAALGFVQGPASAEPVDVAAQAQDQLLRAVCHLDEGRTRVLVLAQAPADLGNLVLRWKAPCRA
jgi:hypothetical protein